MADDVLIDGEAHDRLPADDRGLAYGDGVFRTLRITAGRPVAWAAQRARLAHDCAALDLTMPAEAVLEADIERLFVGRRSGVCKIMVTRGSGGRGYTPPGEPGVRRIVSAHALPAHGDRPRPLTLARSPVELACQPALAGIKHLNRLEQVLARRACAQAGAEDAWMADAAGQVVSTTLRNLFFLDRDGGWITPAITRAGIIGATRTRLIAALAQHGLPFSVRDIAIAELDGFAGALACNSVGGIVAVSGLDGRALTDSMTMAATARRLLDDD